MSLGDVQTSEIEVPVEGTDKSIAINRPDQGQRIVQVVFDSPNMAIHVWEGPDGDDIEGFRQRWNEFVAGDAPDLVYFDARFGRDAYICRASIPHVFLIAVQYHRREDIRAGMARTAEDRRGLADLARQAVDDELASRGVRPVGRRVPIVRR